MYAEVYFTIEELEVLSMLLNRTSHQDGKGIYTSVIAEIKEKLSGSVGKLSFPEKYAEGYVNIKNG